MRRVCVGLCVVVSGSLLVVIGGCGFFPGSRVRPGFRLEWIMPPIVRQESDFIVEESGVHRRAMPLTQTLPPWNSDLRLDQRFAPADQARELYRPPAAFLAMPEPPPAVRPPLQSLTSEEQYAVIIELLRRCPPLLPPPPATREERAPRSAPRSPAPPACMPGVKDER